MSHPSAATEVPATMTPSIRAVNEGGQIKFIVSGKQCEPFGATRLVAHDGVFRPQGPAQMRNFTLLPGDLKYLMRQLRSIENASSIALTWIDDQHFSVVVIVRARDEASANKRAIQNQRQITDVIARSFGWEDVEVNLMPTRMHAPATP